MPRGKKVNFDEYVDNYDQLLAQDTSFFADADYFAEYKVMLSTRVVPGRIARLHEFGCGTGRNLPLLRRHFPAAALWASDISGKSVEIARSTCQDAVVWHEGHEEPSEPCVEQDLVFVAGVFHHIAPPLRADAMRCIVDRLAARGHLLVFEQNPYNPITRRIVARCPYDEDAVLLTPKALRALGRGGGLTHVRTSYTLFFPPSLAVLQPVEAYLGWLPMGGQYLSLFRKP